MYHSLSDKSRLAPLTSPSDSCQFKRGWEQWNYCCNNLKTYSQSCWTITVCMWVCVWRLTKVWPFGPLWMTLLYGLATTNDDSLLINLLENAPLSAYNATEKRGLKRNVRQFENVLWLKTWIKSNVQLHVYFVLIWSKGKKYPSWHLQIEALKDREQNLNYLLLVLYEKMWLETIKACSTIKNQCWLLLRK